MNDLSRKPTAPAVDETELLTAELARLRHRCSILEETVKVGLRSAAVAANRTVVYLDDDLISEARGERRTAIIIGQWMLIELKELRTEPEFEVSFPAR